MSWLGRIFGGVAKSTARQPAQWFLDWITGGKTAAGKPVNARTAQAAPTVAACVRVVREDVAKLPLILYQSMPKGGKRRATEHDLYRLLHDAPDPAGKLTSFEWREMMQEHLELRGNAYSQLVRNARGRVVALAPWHPDKVLIKRATDDGMLFYQHLEQGVTVTMADMLHLRGPISEDGVTGKSTVRVLCETIGAELMGEDNQAKLLKNGQRPPGILVHPAGLSEVAEKNIRESWEKQTNAENRGKTAILEEGMKYIQVGMTNEDAQALESRKFTRSQIAAGWRIPPHKIGDLDKATFSNIEHQALEYVTDSLLPRLRRFEAVLNITLLTEAERKAGYFFEFLVDGLLRGDIKSRYDAYAIGRNWGWLSANDIAELENRNPIPNGDIYLQPLNMVEAGSPPPAPEPAPPPAPDDDEEVEEEDADAAA